MLIQQPAAQHTAGHIIHQIIEDWNGTGNFDELLQKIDLLVPGRWGKVPFRSPLSSDGSPIQVSIDSAAPSQLRFVFDPMNQGLSGWSLIDLLNRIFSFGNRQILTKIVESKGVAIPYFSLGLPIKKASSHAKFYMGKITPVGTMLGIFERLVRAGILPAQSFALLQSFDSLWRLDARAHGISFSVNNGVIGKINVYFRVFQPYTQQVLENLLGAISMSDLAEQVEKIGLVMGLDAPAIYRGYFGATLILEPNAGVSGLKIEHGRTIQSGPDERWAATVKENTGLDVEPSARLEAIISKACGTCPKGPEGLSVRILKSGQISLVSYFTLPPLNP